LETQELLVIERNVFITISILLLLIYTVMRNAFPRIFGTTFNVSSLFVFRVKEEIGLSLKFLSKGQFFLTAIYALTLSFLLLYLGIHLIDEETILFNLIAIKSYWGGLLTWLMVSLGVYFSTFIKLIFLFSISWLFNLNGGYKRQFSDFFITSSVFLLLISTALLFLLYAQVFSGVEVARFLAPLVGVFLIYRAILIYFKLFSTLGFSKLYIFSYICTTELIPLFVGIKYLMK